MYDKFKALQILDKQDFGFTPTRYEIWEGGKMTAHGKTKASIIATTTIINGEEKVVVTYNEPGLNPQLALNNTFDEFVTSADRLQLITIPNQTNAENSMAIKMFKMTLGPTRDFKHFNENEPYCCNLFIKEGNIDKITFSFSSPEKLMEFYSDINFYGDDDQEEVSGLDLDFLFTSSDHIRYENGSLVSGPHGEANRAIKVEANITGGEGYSVTIFNLDGDHPAWQSNVQMAPKQMKLITVEQSKIVLRGFGQDNMGQSFSDYGLTIHHHEGNITKCVLHMHDRHVAIEYLK
jgi:hypothetical protein